MRLSFPLSETVKEDDFQNLNSYKHTTEVKIRLQLAIQSFAIIKHSVRPFVIRNYYALWESVRN